MREIFFLIRLAVFPFRFVLMVPFLLAFWLLLSILNLLYTPFAFLGAALRGDERGFQHHLDELFFPAMLRGIFANQFRWLRTGSDE